MNRTGAQSTAEAELLALVYELLDAHADTIQLGTEWCEALRWGAHLDYLRALQRQTRAILARWPPGATEPR